MSFSSESSTSFKSLHDLKLQQWLQCRICGDTRRNMVPCRPGEIQTCGSEQCLAVISNDSPASHSGNDSAQANAVASGSRSGKFLILS